MTLFDVYPLYDITPVSAKGATVKDDKGVTYLDFYGGHGVISIGHAHPAYVKAISEQVSKIGFYSNSIKNPLQEELARRLATLSGYEDYRLFLCNSGAEANENALKLASFHTGKSKVIAFKKGFHGRTSAAVAATDNLSIIAPLNAGHEVLFLPLDDEAAFLEATEEGDIAAVIIEGIQGVGGLDQASASFFQLLRRRCTEKGIVLILDEIQSGYGRSGKFFAHQFHDIKADIISVAKGMGNGFPIGGILISPEFKASHGLLGTTFGGNHLACAAALSVLEVIETEKLMENVNAISAYFLERAREIQEVAAVKGKGLMLGLQFADDIAALRKEMIVGQHIFTGNASDKKLLRILPPLNITKDDVDTFFTGLKKALQEIKLTAQAAIAN